MPERVKIEPWYEQIWWPIFKGKNAADLVPPTKAESQTGVLHSEDGQFSIGL